MKYKIKNEIKVIRNSIILFVILIVIFAAALVGVYNFSGSNIQNNAKTSLELLDEETTYPHSFIYSYADRIDNFTDKLIIKAAAAEEEHALHASAIIQERVQYWQGFVIILRPLLNVFDWAQIRAISMVVFYGLCFGALLTLQKTIGTKAALAYGGALISINMSVIPLCMQFVLVFDIMLVALILIALLKQWWTNDLNRLGYLFLILGATTNYFDFLTTPIVTLAIPLSLVLIIIIQYMPKISGLKILFLGVKNSLIWILTYGATFVAKWIYASVVLKKNVLNEALDAGTVRFNGEQESFVLDRTEMFQRNFSNILGFDSFEWKLAIIVLVVIIAAIIVVYCLQKNRIDARYYFLLLCAVMPYLWFFILANHSQIHFWFTYRAQIVLIFVITFLCIEWACQIYNSIKHRKIRSNK